MNSEKISFSSVEQNENRQETDRLKNAKIGKKALAAESLKTDPDSLPDGFLSVRAFSNKIGISSSAIDRKINELGIIKTKYKSRGRYFEFLSPDQQQKITEALEYLIDTPKAPDGYISSKELAKQLGVGEGLINKKSKELSIEKHVFKDKVGKISSFLSPSQQNLIADALSENLTTDIAPDDYESINNFAKKIGVNPMTVQKTLNNHGVILQKYKGQSGRIYPFLSPNQQDFIKTVLSDIIKTSIDIPDGYITITDFMDKIGISEARIRKELRSLGIETVKIKNQDGRILAYLSPEQQSLIERALEDLIVAKVAPDGYKTVRDIVLETGLGGTTIKRKINELHLSPHIYKDSSGRLVSYYSPEQVEALSSQIEQLYSTKKAPNDYMNLSVFAEETGISKDAINKRISDLGIELIEMRDSVGRVTKFLSPEQQNAIIESLDILSAEEAPDNYKTANQIADYFGVDDATIRKKIAKLNIHGTDYRYKGGICAYYSPSQQDQIHKELDDLLNISEAPEGYLSSSAFAAHLGVGIPIVDNKIDELQIIRAQYKDGAGKIAYFLSPEQQKQIIKSLEDYLKAEKAPDGFLTVQAFSRKIGIATCAIRSRIEALDLELEEFKSDGGNIRRFLSPKQQYEIYELLRKSFAGTSLPENTVAFYFSQVHNIKQNLRPNWLKNPKTGRNLEVDVFIESLRIGIEYDGYFHQDPEKDIKKDRIARKNGYMIVHIREDGLPELPEDAICIQRKNNASKKDLGESIRKCFKLLNIPEPDINISRDKRAIFDFMHGKTLGNLDSEAYETSL